LIVPGIDYVVFLQRFVCDSITVIMCIFNNNNKKAQLSLTNPRDAKACQKLHQKTRIMGLPDGEEIMTSFLRFDTIPARDRQTDGRTDRHVAVAKTRASIASRR